MGLLKNNKYKTKGLTEKQKETFEDLEAQIVSMLIQHGGSIKQNEISSNLDLPLDLITSKLLELEKEGTLERTWRVDEFTYQISKK